MKKEMLSVALSIALLAGTGIAYAGSNHQGANDRGDRDDRDHRDHRDDRGPRAVPEIDATSGIPAIALVLGVALLGAERLRRRSKRAS